MVNVALELVGVLCVLGFAYLVYPPAALLLVGAFLIFVANNRAFRSGSSSREGGIE